MSSIVTESVKVMFRISVGSKESMTSGTIMAVENAIVTLVRSSVCAKAQCSSGKAAKSMAENIFLSYYPAEEDPSSEYPSYIQDMMGCIALDVAI